MRPHLARAVSSPPSAPLPAADSAVDTDSLYRAHASTIARWAVRLGGPGIDPNDVVQEVFLVAQRRLTLFRPEGGRITTWLFRTTEKIVQTARRKQRLRRWLARWAGPPPGLGEARPVPGEALERRQEVASVYRVLDRMPERLRRVLVLFELEEMSTQEIAELVGARIGTVRVWLFRARARFIELHAKEEET
ncbi:MAG TPA: sigma-70 family RNA polymerase sigma factor [Polyangia bacterium]